VRIIKTSTLLAYGKKYSAARNQLAIWALIASRAVWGSIDDVRITYPHADAVLVKSKRTVTVFNIAGNNYRLIVAIHYNTQKVYIRDFMTHASTTSNPGKEGIDGNANQTNGCDRRLL
jgi:mRNA interferase HigB